MAVKFPYFAIDQQDPLIRGVMTPWGTAVLALLAWLLIAPHFGIWESALAVLGALGASRFSHHRAAIIFATSTISIVVGTWAGDIDTVDHISAVMTTHHINSLNPELVALGCLLVWMLSMSWMLRWVSKHPHALMAKKPLLTLLVMLVFLCVLGQWSYLDAQASVLVWSFIFTLTPYLWFLTYAIVDQRLHPSTHRIQQMGIIRPFWSPTYLPHGKGHAYLEKYAAPSTDVLAVTQLKAIKLLIWANVLFLCHELLHWIFNDLGHLPSLTDTIDIYLRGQPLTWAMSGLALLVSHAKFCLQVAYWAHVFVGIARLAGYRLPRGSWRPLESLSLADYFNRFHFYFKELLIDLFFMPTFLKCFRKHPKIRQFFATFMAAGVGNAIWHFFREVDLIATHGWMTSLATFTSYVFYCVVLATGIGVSQWRTTHRLPQPITRRDRLVAFVLIWTFVTGLHVFGDGTRTHTLWERLQFFAFLCGVS